MLQIRAQASVLKKAVLEEQTRNAELRDTLKEKEQSLRKAEQEMDSLTFRNQQLTKRVTVLQDELDLMQV
jgi:protein phosphatase 1 regulatory subunit 21